MQRNPLFYPERRFFIQSILKSIQKAGRIIKCFDTYDSSLSDISSDPKAKILTSKISFDTFDQ